MTTRVAINGLGRIGRAILKLVLEEPAFELAAVNDRADAENLAYLLRFDTVYGRYARPVAVEEGALSIAGRKLRTLQCPDASALPWKELDIGLVFECTGTLTRRVELEQHLRAGARTVLLSAPAEGPDVETVIHAANVPEAVQGIFSCGSSTANCIAPIVEVIGRRIGIRKALMTNVPASTGAALATTRALPEYAGRLDGIALRAPIVVGAIADLTFVTARRTSAEEINAILAEEAGTRRYAGVLGVSADPLVSSDIIGDPRASVVDLQLTRVVDGDLVKVMSWYDNEWGYANQMLREARALIAGRRY